MTDPDGGPAPPPDSRFCQPDRRSEPALGEPRVATASRPYAVWQSPNYRLYAISWFLIVFGKAVETVAVGIHIYDRTRDPLALGWLGLVQALPIIVLAMAGGQIADRFDRRRVLMVMLAVTSGVAAGLAVVSATGAPVRWMYMLLGLGAIGQALGGPARAAFLPQLVPAESFSHAVTWNSSVFQTATMIGPAVGGLIVGATQSATTAFLLIIACRLLSLAAISAIRPPPVERTTEPVTLETFLAGIRFVWRTRLILATIALDLFAVLLGGATYLLPIYAQEILKVGPSGLGFLRSAEAVGAVSMAMLLAHLPPLQRAGRTMLLAVAGFGVATIVYGLSTSFWLSLAMMFLIGALDNISVVVRHTLVQMLTPDAMRGRVSAVNNIFIVASNDIGGLESGLTARLMGPVASVVAGGMGAIAVVISAARIWPEILTIGSLADVRPLDSSAAPAASAASGADSPGDEESVSCETA